MSEPEKNKIILMVRMRGSGKTPTIIGLPEYGVPSLAHIYIKKGMKAILIDSEDHPAYRGHVKDIPPGTSVEEINAAPADFYRIYGTNFDAMFYFINKIWNAVFIYEDPKKYFGDRLDKPTRALFLATKNRNCDTIFMAQSWRYVMPELYDIADGINIGKTGDSPEGRKAELGANYEKVYAAWKEVMAHSDKHIHCYVPIN